MTKRGPFSELVSLARTQYPNTDFTFLKESIYSEVLSPEKQHHCVRLIEFARSQQTNNPVYETIYHQLLHLYVLNGSRIDVLSSLDRRIRGVAEGQTALVLVSGISGIGKTSLVLALQERIEQVGARLIIARCSEQESTSYAPWQDVAHSISAAGMPLETLLAPIGKGHQAQSSQHLKQALADWLKACAAIQPLVILLDDLHWADADSLEILDYLTSQTVPTPILFVATYRSEETHLKHALYDFLPKLQRNRLIDLLQLEPLTPNDIERFATVYCGACTPELVTYLHDRAEGHPLFTVELLNDLIVQDLLTQDENGRYLPPAHLVSVSSYLKQLITRRVNRLGAQVEKVLSIAAVAGEAWSLKIIGSLVEMPEGELLDAVESALRAEIITIEDDRDELYRFSHGLIRQVLYTSQMARRRKRVHEQIAAQFEYQQPSNIFATAYHYIEAEQWEKAVDYCLKAGEQAAQRFASYSALQWYQQALTAAEQVKNTLPPALLFDIYDRLGRTHMALGQFEEAEIIYSRLRDVTQSIGDLIAEGHALVHLAYVRMRRYQLDLAERTAYEALKIAEQTEDLQLITTVHSSLGNVLFARGQLDPATIHYNKALNHAELLEDSSQFIDMLRLNAYQAIWLGQYQKAEEFSRQALKFSQKASDPLTVVGAYQNIAFVQIESGQYHEAYQTLHTTLKAIKESGSHHHQEPRLLNLMGYLYLELGNAQEALAWDQKALEAIHDTFANNLEMRRYTLLNIATDYLHLEKSEEVQETITLFEAVKAGAEFVYFRYFNRYQLLLCEFYLRQHKFEQAIELAQEARSLAQSKGILKNIAKSHWFEGQALAEMMRFEEALGQLETAVNISDNIHHGSLRWKIRLSLADVQRKSGHSPEKTTRQAWELIYHTSQSLSGSSLQALFHSSNWFKQLSELEENPTPKTPTYPAGLTSREVEVLQWVAKGATNQQVADALHISVRTVNTHMTNILNKTNCDNRTAASAFAIQHNLVST